MAALPRTSYPNRSKAAIEVFPLNTGGASLGTEIEHVCIDNVLVITTWSPIPFEDRAEEAVLEGDKSAFGAWPFWDDTLRYLYLPRLKSSGRAGTSHKSRARALDFFGTAYGQLDGKFDGFKFGDANVQLDGTLLLIDPWRRHSTRPSILEW